MIRLITQLSKDYYTDCLAHLHSPVPSLYFSTQFTEEFYGREPQVLKVKVCYLYSKNIISSAKIVVYVMASEVLDARISSLLRFTCCSHLNSAEEKLWPNGPASRRKRSQVT